MADDSTPLDTTPTGGGTGTRADDSGPLDTTPEGGGTGTRAPTQAPGPRPSPKAPAPMPYVPQKPPPKPAFMTPVRWGVLGLFVVGAGVAAWELTPKRGR